MDITTRIKEGVFVELQVKSGNTTLTEDLAISKNEGWKVPNEDIEQFLNIAYECNRFNGISDVDFVKNVFDLFLIDSEKERFIELALSK